MRRRMPEHRQCFHCETMRTDGALVHRFRGKTLAATRPRHVKLRAVCEMCLFNAAEMLLGAGKQGRRIAALARRVNGQVIFQ